jgi:hypothetical protein
MFVYRGGRILQSLAKKVQPNLEPLPARKDNITEEQVSKKFIEILGRDGQFLPVSIE